MTSYDTPAQNAGSPLHAPAGRLATTLGANPRGISTSNLSTSEYVLLREAGFEPLGLVLGSAVYHLGIQVGRWGKNQELTALTQTMYWGRRVAMDRMEAEAAQLGADGVLEVGVGLVAYEWSDPNVCEFRAIGTAVRAVSGRDGFRRPDGRPFTFGGTVQAFYRLLTAGAVPVAFVFGTCAYHIAHRTALQALAQMGTTREIEMLTAGLYEARELSLSRMQAEATQAGATSIISIELNVLDHSWGEHAAEFRATGWAIRHLDTSTHIANMSATPTLTLGLD